MSSADLLRAKNINELRGMFTRMGGSAPRSDTKEMLVQRLLLVQASPQTGQEPPKPAPKPHVEALDEDGLRHLLAAHIANGMEVICHENCWTLRARGREDSGTLSQPANVIRRCADTLVGQMA